MATFQVNASKNDGFKNIDGGGSWSYTDNSLPFGQVVFDEACTFALRFTGVNIPQGSTINTATLTGVLESFGIPSGTLRTKVYGIDQDNTADFSTDPTGRPKTSAVVDWDEASKTDPIVSPSLVSIVQEIVDRGGWSSGNALGFLIEDDGSASGARSKYYAYDGSSGNAYVLTVTWTAPPTSTSSSTTSTSTSTSTTNTSSSTSSSSTTTPVPDPNYAQGIVRVTKEGKDVMDSNFLDDFFLDSRYTMLKIHDYGTFSTGITGTKTIEHDLGYIPYVVVFSQYLEDDGGGGVNISDEYYQHDWYLYGASYYSTGYTKIYDDKIVITIENINTPTPGVINGFYFIFKEEAT